MELIEIASFGDGAGQYIIHSVRVLWNYSVFCRCFVSIDICSWSNALSCVIAMCQLHVSSSCVIFMCHLPVSSSCVIVICHLHVSSSCVIVMCHCHVSSSCVTVMCHLPVSLSCVIGWWRLAIFVLWNGLIGVPFINYCYSTVDKTMDKQFYAGSSFSLLYFQNTYLFHSNFFGNLQTS